MQLNKTGISLSFVGYDVIIANSAVLRDSSVIYNSLSHAIKYTIQPIRGVESRCVFCSIQRVAAFRPLLVSDSRNSAKSVCVRYKMAPKL